MQEIWMCGFQGTQKPYMISGDNGERDPPVPIPNTEVKPFSADGTWLETTWESRTLPDSTKKSLRRCLGLFLCASRQVLLPGRFQANVQHCTWLGSPMCAASGGSSTWGTPGRVGRCRIAPTRNPAHIRRARIAHPYGLRKKPPVLNSGRLFAYSSDFET